MGGVRLDDDMAVLLAGAGGPAAATAARLVVATAELLGAADLVAVESAHIDGCLYHGDSGVLFAERLTAGGGRVRVPATLNVGALDLLHPERVRYDAARAAMARRQMAAYEALGCRPTWTCAPYQAGHRPRLGAHVAWGESNAVAFVNSVLGARTNRLGDLLDICCALTGRAPNTGLHLTENRRAALVLDVSGLSSALKESEAFYPVLGSLVGRIAGSAVPAIAGLPPGVPEDRLKALGAAAASSGAVALFHAVGSTPEAPTLDAALQGGGGSPGERIAVTPAMVREARDALSTAAAGTGARIDAVAIGSPHLSRAEFDALRTLAAGIPRFAVPFYACTSRAVWQDLERDGEAAALAAKGVVPVIDTCVVVAPVLPASSGVLMTNSGKFAYYAPGNTGYATVFGSLADCVASAASGVVRREEALWA
ncbi:MAG TPA: aconitase X catalytic domain-containing protein [Stellaceae bacterium]